MKPSDKRIIALKTLKNCAHTIRVRRALKELNGHSHFDLAIMLNTSRQNISLHINGERHTPEIMQGLASIWQVPVEEIFDDAKTTDA